ncbi:hypothetical protein [Luteimonas saliphila]|nr:hypothetical protein [Luteimonas saliphila]
MIIEQHDMPWVGKITGIVAAASGGLLQASIHRFAPGANGDVRTGTR